MIGGHWWVLLILAAIALIIFGPSRLPELGSGLGKAMREFRKATTEMGDAMKDDAKVPTENTPTATGMTYTSTKATPADPVTPPAPSPAPPSEAPKA